MRLVSKYRTNKKTREQVTKDVAETVDGFDQLQPIFEKMIQTNEFKQMLI